MPNRLAQDNRSPGPICTVSIWVISWALIIHQLPWGQLYTIGRLREWSALICFWSQVSLCLNATLIWWAVSGCIAIVWNLLGVFQTNLISPKKINQVKALREETLSQHSWDISFRTKNRRSIPCCFVCGMCSYENTLQCLLLRALLQRVSLSNAAK